MRRMSLRRTTLGEEEYLDRCAKRTSAVLTFSRSEEFYEGILIGPLSSIPRWKYDRVIEAAGREDGFPRTDDALNALLGISRGVISGRNPTVGHCVNRGGKSRGELGSPCMRRSCARLTMCQGRMSSLLTLFATTAHRTFNFV